MKLLLQYRGADVEVEYTFDSRHLLVRFLDRQLRAEVVRWEPPFFAIKTASGMTRGAFFRGRDFIDLHLPEGRFRLGCPGKRRGGPHEHGAGGLHSPMPGKVVQVLVAAGQAVQAGDPLVIVEAMKMEHRIVAPQAGVVAKVFFRAGDKVSQGEALLALNDEAG